MNTCSHCANLKSSIESYPICDDPLSRSARCCLVPRPQFFARPKRFGSRGPSENVPRIRHRSELTKRDWENAVQVSYRDLARRGAASLLNRNYAKITQKRQNHSKTTPIKLWTAKLSGTILFRAIQELSGIKYTATGYYRLPPSWKFGFFTFFQRYVFTVHEYRITVCYGRSQESSCWKQGTRFVRVMENLESYEISGILLPVTETRGKLKSLVTADVKARTEKHRDK